MNAKELADEVDALIKELRKKGYNDPFIIEFIKSYYHGGCK
jgi:hypothetical protein